MVWVPQILLRLTIAGPRGPRDCLVRDWMSPLRPSERCDFTQLLGSRSWSGPTRQTLSAARRPLVGERDRIARIRAEIRVRFEVGEHRRDALCAREPAGENLARNLLERDAVSLPIQGGDDLVEAQEVAD